MKKIIGFTLSTAMLILCLGSCGKPEEKLPDATDEERPWDISIDLDSWGKDNSLDAYSAALNIPLLAEEPENVVGQMKIERERFLGADRAYFYIAYSAGMESWDELLYVTEDEVTGSYRLDFKERLFGVGPVAGSDHYIGFGYVPPEDDEGENQYFLIERDEKHQAVKEISLDFLASPADTLVWPDYLAADGFGIIHLVEGQKYLLISSEGELLSSANSDTGGLVPLYDGRIAFWESVWDKEGHFASMDLQCMDRETGKPALIATLKENADCVTLLDEKTLLYANREGIYRSSLSGENPEPLYRWITHGIDIGSGKIHALQANAEGEIALIYEDSENYNYLCLKPTTEEVKTVVITLANLAYRDYKPIVTEFNKDIRAGILK